MARSQGGFLLTGVWRTRPGKLDLRERGMGIQTHMSQYLGAHELVRGIGVVPFTSLNRSGDPTPM